MFTALRCLLLLCLVSNLTAQRNESPASQIRSEEGTNWLRLALAHEFDSGTLHEWHERASTFVAPAQISSSVTVAWQPFAKLNFLKLTGGVGYRNIQAATQGLTYSSENSADFSGTPILVSALVPNPSGGFSLPPGVLPGSYGTLESGQVITTVPIVSTVYIGLDAYDEKLSLAQWTTHLGVQLERRFRQTPWTYFGGGGLIAVALGKADYEQAINHAVLADAASSYRVTNQTEPSLGYTAELGIAYQFCTHWRVTLGGQYISLDQSTNWENLRFRDFSNVLQRTNHYGVLLRLERRWGK